MGVSVTDDEILKPRAKHVEGKMEERERDLLADRVARFDRAKQRHFKLEKLRAVIDAIDQDEDHTIGAIIIDVIAEEFRYIPIEKRDQDRGCTICSLTQDDQKQVFREFVSWARENIARKMSNEQEVMDSI